MAGNDSASNVGSKGTPATEPAVAHPADKLRIAFPDTFNGDRKKLKSFLIQVELWMAFNSKYFALEVQQVLWAIALLRGPASDWISSYLADYMTHRAADGRVTTTANQGTKDIFLSWTGFVKQLKANFGDLDERRNAVRSIQALKQKGSAVTYTAEFQQHATLTNWGDEAICDQYYMGLKDHVKDEIARADKPDDLKEMIELAQKIDNRHYERQLEKRGGTSSHQWTQRRRPQQKSHWPQAMELDATFKQGGRPRNPNKERQLKERLCFNCNKPGHMARECKQPKKGNGGRKFGKQLNATWQGKGGFNSPGMQLNATFVDKQDWGINGESTPEEASSDDEDQLDEFDAALEAENELMDKGLTESQKKRLQRFKETASRTAFKDQLPGVVRVMKETMIREERGYPVPDPPTRWSGTSEDWEVAVRKMRCRPDYPQHLEPRGAQHTELEATNWLKYKLAEYDALDAQDEEQRQQAFEGRWRRPEPWELRADQAAMDYEPTSQDVEELREAMEETNPFHEREGEALAHRDVTEIDHPWHQYMEWDRCYMPCRMHQPQKVKNQHFPSNPRPVYYTWPEMKEIVQRRRSTGQLRQESPSEDMPVWEEHPHPQGRKGRETGSPPGPPLEADEYYPSSDESLN